MRDVIRSLTLISVFILCLPQLLYANTEPVDKHKKLAEEPGFGGFLGFAFGPHFTNQQMFVDSDNEEISSIEEPGNSVVSPIIVPLGGVNYTLDGLTSQFYLDVTPSKLYADASNFQFGYRKLLKGGTKLSVSYGLPSGFMTKTWSDPYLTGKSRTETNDNLQQMRFTAENIANTRLTIDTLVGTRNISNERAGESQGLTPAQLDELRRKGQFLWTEVSYILPLSRTNIINAAVNYTKMNAEGNAMSFDRYGTSISLITLLSKSQVITTLSYADSGYEEENPVFNQTQNDHSTGINVLYSYKEPFDWKNWRVYADAGYKKVNSNIAFYESYDVTTLVGMTYTFK